MLTLPVYTKPAALEEIFIAQQVSSRWPSKKISLELFLEVISRDTYNLSKDLGVCAQTVSRIIKLTWPDKPKTTSKLCNYLLIQYGYKTCAKCHTVLPLDNFHNNTSKNTGKDSYCKLCFNDSVRDYRKYYRSLYRSAKLNRTPAWADIESIREFYANCPIGYHVDHILPLQGTHVSGFHTLGNLQYLLASDNINKSNKYTPV